MVKIEWTEAAIKDLEKLDRPVIQRILRRLTWFANNFEKAILEPLDGEFKGSFKLRIGDWRVVYTLEDEAIVIQFVGHRRGIYKIK